MGGGNHCTDNLRNGLLRTSRGIYNHKRGKLHAPGGTAADPRAPLDRSVQQPEDAEHQRPHLLRRDSRLHLRCGEAGRLHHSRTESPRRKRDAYHEAGFVQSHGAAHHIVAPDGRRQNRGGRGDFGQTALLRNIRSGRSSHLLHGRGNPRRSEDLPGAEPALSALVARNRGGREIADSVSRFPHAESRQS